MVNYTDAVPEDSVRNANLGARSIMITVLKNVFIVWIEMVDVHVCVEFRTDSIKKSYEFISSYFRYRQTVEQIEFF